MYPKTREEEWNEFSSYVRKHLVNYTVPQYGDKGFDQVTEWDAKDLIVQISKYCKRFGTNSRPGQQELDLLKVAHYACMCYYKLKEDMPKQDDDILVSTGNRERIQHYLDNHIYPDDVQFDLVLRRK